MAKRKGGSTKGLQELLPGTTRKGAKEVKNQFKQVTGDRTCGRRGCDRSIGVDRFWCSEHTPRTPDKQQLSFLKGTYVFGVPSQGAPYEVLGHFDNDPEAYSFRKQLQAENEYGYVTPMGRSIIVSSSDTALNGSPEMRQAIEDYLDLLERGEATMATLKDATKKAATRDAKGNKTATRSRTPQDCACGCGGQTGGGKFLPGHDAKHKGNLQRAYREATTAAARASIVKQFAVHGWEQYVPDLEAEKAKKAKAAERLAALKAKKAKEAKKVVPINKKAAKKNVAAKK